MKTPNSTRFIRCVLVPILALTAFSAVRADIGSGVVAPYLNGVFPQTDPTNGGSQPPALLSQTGAFTNLSSLAPSPALIPYTVNAPLWSDAAEKSRWISVPSDGNRNSAGEKVAFSASAPWTFPAGTVAMKHFELATNANIPAQRRRLETRFLVATGGGNFYGVTYRWRPDGSDADLLPDMASDEIVITETGGSTRTQRWDYPGRADCRACHNPGGGVFLGLRTHQLNGEFAYPGESSPRNQLAAWAAANLFTGSIGSPSGYPRANAMGDLSASPEHRVHSYLAANCANCHYPGNLNSGFDLRFETPLANQNMLNGSVLYDLGINGAKVVAPGEPNRSVLYLRMNTVGLHKMPPIGRNVIDQAAVDVVRDWIVSLDSGPPSGGNNPPIANNDEGLTPQGTPTGIAAFGNDYDADGDIFTLSQSTAPSNGTANWNGSGVVTYSPVGGFTGTDSFTYRIIDSRGAVSNSATITVTVTPANTSNALSFSDRSTRLPDPSNAGGVAMAVVDMDQDGLDDIVHLDQAKDLYIEYQKPAGANFTRRSLGSPSNIIAWGMAVGDADNNGKPDIITGGYYDGLHYYRANSAATSYSKTDLNSPSIFLQAINFVDINRDGWLDVFACHDDGHSPKFRNLGNGVLVSDTGMMNTRTQPTSDDSGNYGTVWTDYDNDGDLDLYVSKCRVVASSASDPRRINQLFRNNGSGQYTEVAANAGLALGQQSWVADFGDIDNDGDLDCFVGNHMESSKLMRNNGNGTFTDVTAARGISVTWNVIQSVFRDFNNDGWMDLLLTGQQHELWLNDRDGTFTLAANPFTANLMESCAVGDLNRDGFPDVYAGYAALYNTPAPSRPDKMFVSNPNGNGFLSLTLRGRQSNRLASGARIELYGPWGVQVREVRSGEGYGVTHSYTQTFGYGNVASASSLTVRWPSGAVDNASNVSANQFRLLEEGDTQPPVLTNPGNRASAAGSPVQLQLAASDPHGNALTFSASNLPTGLQIQGSTGLISGTTAATGGTFPVTVSVTDGWSTVSRSFSWVITVVDNEAPTVTLATASATVTGNFEVAVNFSEPVTGLTSSDFVATGGTVGILSGSGATYSLGVTPTVAGTVTLRLPANRATDPSGNANLISNLLSVTSTPPGGGDIVPDANTIALYRMNGNFQDASANALHLTAAGTIPFVGNAARFDALGDKLTVTIPDSLVLPGNGNPLALDFRIYPRAWLAYSNANQPIVSLYQEWNSYLALEDQKWGANPKGPNVQSSNGIVANASQWASAVPLNQWSRVRLVFNGNTTVTLSVNNVNVSSASLPPLVSRTNAWQLTLGSFDGDLDEVHLTRSVPATGPDTQSPSLVLAGPAGPVSGAFQVTATFDEPVLGFVAGDIVAGNGTVSGFSGSGASYQFTVEPTAEGTVNVSVPAGRAADVAGNPSLASNALAVTYTVTLPPTGGGDERSPDSKTVALYHFNTDFRDSSSNGFHLAVAGSVPLVADNLGWMGTPSGKIARFDAVGDTLTATLPDAAVLPGGQPLTIEARIFPRGWLGYAVENLPVIGLHQEWDSHFLVEDQKWGLNPKGPAIKASNNTLVSAAQWAAAVTPNAWHTLRIVFDGNATTSVLVDGSQIASASFPPNVSRANAWTLTLGNFSGDLDEVYVTRSLISDGPDTTPPTVTLSTASSVVTGPFAVSAAFSEDITGFTLSDLAVTNGTASALTGAGRQFGFTVTPQAAGSVSIRLPAARVVDAAGNANTDSNLLAVTYNNSPPPTGSDEYGPDATTVALYHFNTNYQDSSGNDLHLTASGGVSLRADNLSWMTTPGGQVARFGAVGDTLVATLPDSLVLPSGSTPLTIEARVYPRAWLGYSVANLPVVSLFQEWDTSLELQDAKWGANPKGPRVTSADVPIATAAQWAAAAPLNAWALLQISFNGSGTVTARINGQVTGSVSITPNRDRVSPWTLTLGNFSGDIDEVRVRRGIPSGSGSGNLEVVSASEAVVGEALVSLGLDGSAMDDPDHDGWINLLEIALGSNPMSGDTSLFAVDATAPGVTFPVPAAARSIGSGFETAAFVYRVEISMDLSEWRFADVTETERLPLGNGFDRVTLHVESATTPNTYLRLRVDGK